MYSDPLGFQFRKEQQSVAVEVTGFLNDSQLGNAMGAFLKLSSTVPQEPLFVDLSRCEWADPNPLLALSLAVGIWSISKREVTITIPEPRTKGPTKFGRFLAFLAQERFLRSFSDLCRAKGASGSIKIVFPGDNPAAGRALEEVEELLSKTAQDLVYRDSQCVGARVVDLGRVADMRLLVDDFIREAERHNTRQHFADPGGGRRPGISDINPIYVVHDLRTVLTELLQNVKEHAYRGCDRAGLDAEFCPVAVYVRKRWGMPELLTTPREMF